MKYGMLMIALILAMCGGQQMEYEMQVDTTQTFTNPIISTKTTSDSIIKDTLNLNDGNYFWRVKVENQSGISSPWSAVEGFGVDYTLPLNPTPYSPIGWLTTTTVNFYWSEGFEVGSGIDYYITEINATIVDTVYDTTMVKTLSEGQYFWYVKAVDVAGNVGGYSPSANFSIDTTAPSVVTLISPTDNSYLGSTTVDFVWNSATDNLSGVDHYILQYAYDDIFTQGMNEVVVNDTFCQVVFTDSIYYWKVKAVDVASNEGVWSTTWLFYMQSQAPSAPIINYPKDNQWLLDSIVEFEYQSSAVQPENIGAEWNPTGDAIGGGPGYSANVTVHDYLVTNRTELLNALASATAGEVVYVDDNGTIDLTGQTDVINVPEYVTLASGRGNSGGTVNFL